VGQINPVIVPLASHDVCFIMFLTMRGPHMAHF